MPGKFLIVLQDPVMSFLVCLLIRHRARRRSHKWGNELSRERLLVHVLRFLLFPKLLVDLSQVVAGHALLSEQPGRARKTFCTGCISHLEVDPPQRIPQSDELGTHAEAGIVRAGSLDGSHDTGLRMGPQFVALWDTLG